MDDVILCQLRDFALNERDGSIMLRKFTAVMAAAFVLAGSASAQELCDAVRGSTVVAQDDESTMLGKITNAYDAQSIFNEYGLYGSEYQAKSMWSEFGQFGSPYGLYSANNPTSSQPPMIIKNGKVIGFVSSNKSIRASVPLNLIKALCKETM